MRSRTEAQEHICSTIITRACGEIETAINGLHDSMTLSREVTKLLLARRWVWERLQATLKENEYTYTLTTNEGLEELESASAVNDRKPLKGWEGKEIKVVWVTPDMNKPATLTEEQKSAIKDVLAKAKEAADNKSAIEEAKAERDKLLAMMPL